MTTLMKVFNQILAGGEVPPSFLEGQVVPLRKNGDFDNPMDYRPITMLSTCYKIVAVIIMARLQKQLWKIIGETQKGFVKSRVMEKSVTLIQAILQRAFHGEHLPMEESPGAVLLDFKKTLRHA